jgi:hypothetical protein
MGIVELPEWRLKSQVSDRAALRTGMANTRARVRVITAKASPVVRADWCDRCAAPIEGGAVTRGPSVYCSVECSLEGPDRTA